MELEFFEPDIATDSYQRIHLIHHILQLFPLVRELDPALDLALGNSEAILKSELDARRSKVLLLPKTAHASAKFLLKEALKKHASDSVKKEGGRSWFRTALLETLPNLSETLPDLEAELVNSVKQHLIQEPVPDNVFLEPQFRGLTFNSFDTYDTLIYSM